MALYAPPPTPWGNLIKADILAMAFSYIGEKQILVIAPLVCNHWKGASLSERLWRPCLQRDLPNLREKSIEEQRGAWKLSMHIDRVFFRSKLPRMLIWQTLTEKDALAHLPKESLEERIKKITSLLGEYQKRIAEAESAAAMAVAVILPSDPFSSEALKSLLQNIEALHKSIAEREVVE